MLAQVLPDYLPRPISFCAEPTEDRDEEEKDYREWLSASIRCYLDADVDNVSSGSDQLTLYRLPAFWFLVTVDGSLRVRSSQWLETFASLETEQAILTLLDDKEKAAVLPVLGKLKSSRWPFPWLGLPIDLCSVGVCAVGFAKKVLKLLIEPIDA